MKLAYTIIYVADVSATVAFYRAAFGLEPRFVHESDTYAEMETGATALAFASEEHVSATCPGFRPNRKVEAPAGAEVGFVVDDVAQAFAHAVAAGAESYAAPKEKPWGQIVSYVRDCNGFLVELCTAIGN